jgi:uncharacterized protein (TIGR02284 family)
MTQTSASLAELVSALNDGVAFYGRAAQKVGDPGLVDLFTRMAALKQRIAADINAEIALEGAPPRETGSVFGALRRFYADLSARIGEEEAPVYIARLEEQEDRLLAAFREAVLGGDSDKVRMLALRFYPEIDAMHAEMSRLKKRT